MGSQGHVRESMDVATTGNPGSTQQQRKAGRKSAAKLRRNSRRLIEYNTKKAISVIRNSLAARMQSGTKSLVENHKRAFQTRQQYYRNIIFGLHQRLEKKDEMIAKLGVCCDHLYRRVKNKEFTSEFQNHLIAKYDWLRSGLSKDEIIRKIDWMSESYAAERRAFPRKRLAKQRITPVHSDRVNKLPGEMEARVATLKLERAARLVTKAAVNARPPASKQIGVSGESSGTQTRTVSIKAMRELKEAAAKRQNDFIASILAKQQTRK